MSQKDIHKNQTKIRDSGKYEIWYSYHDFIAYKDDKKVAFAKTELELQGKIKDFEASQRKFKPFKVIRVDREVEGKITSRDAQYPDDHVVFSYKTGGTTYHGKVAHGHTGVLVQRYDGDYTFVEATMKNLEILKKIKFQRKKIAALKDDIEKLKEGFEKPVTYEKLDELSGED